MVRIPGSPKPFELSKIHIVEFHITASMQVIAIEANPLSTHLVVKAAQELIEALARHKGIQLRWDPSIFIKPEHIKDYRALSNKAYNYFKHADRDPDASYDGPNMQTLQKLNMITTLMNIDGYSALGGTLSACHTQFSIVTMLMYPGLVKEGFIKSLPGGLEQSELVQKEPEIAITALRKILTSQRLLPSN